MATHSSILAWRIPWTVEPGGLQSTGREKSDMTERLHFHYIKINAYGNEIQHEKYSQLYCNILVTVTINTLLIILQHIEISNHCIVHPELTQCCRSITLKFKKKTKHTKHVDTGKKYIKMLMIALSIGWAFLKFLLYAFMYFQLSAMNINCL